MLFQTSSADKEYIKLGVNFTENVQGYNTRRIVMYLICAIQ